MDALLLAARLVIAAVLAVAGAAKLFDRPGSVEAAQDLGVPERLARLVGPLLPVAELALAAMLVPGITAQWGAGLATALFLSFTVAVAVPLMRGQQPSCHCFGQLHEAPVSRWTVARNLGLTAMAAGVTARGGGDGFVAGGATLVRDAGVSSVVAVLSLLMLSQYVAIGVLLLRLRAVTSRAAEAHAHDGARPPEGRPVGSRAPRFRLSSLAGGRVSLPDLQARGHPIVVLFTDAGCAPCHALYPEVADWQQNQADRLTIAVVASGGLERNRARAEEHGLDPELMLVQRRAEVVRAYGVTGTPSAVLVDADGRLATLVAGGGTAVRRLMADAASRRTDSPTRHAAQPAARPSARLPGDPVPPFELRDPGEGLQVFDLYGRLSILLLVDDVGSVRSMVNGDVAEAMAAGDLQVAVITKRSHADSPVPAGMKVGYDDGLTARAYGLGSAPSAVIVDAHLRFASEPAHGLDQVQALLGRAVHLASLAASARSTPIS